MKKCNICGVETDSAFCPNCGADLRGLPDIAPAGPIEVDIPAPGAAPVGGSAGEVFGGPTDFGAAPVGGSVGETYGGPTDFGAAPMYGAAPAAGAPVAPVAPAKSNKKPIIIAVAAVAVLAIVFLIVKGLGGGGGDAFQSELNKLIKDEGGTIEYEAATYDSISAYDLIYNGTKSHVKYIPEYQSDTGKLTALHESTDNKTETDDSLFVKSCVAMIMAHAPSVTNAEQARSILTEMLTNTTVSGSSLVGSKQIDGKTFLILFGANYTMFSVGLD